MQIVILGVRLAILCLIAIIIRIASGIVVAGAVLGDGENAAAAPGPETSAAAGPTPFEQIMLLVVVVGVAMLEAIALAPWIYRARTRMLPLIPVVAAVIFGVLTLQPMIEATYFGVAHGETIRLMTYMGVAVSVLLAPVAVIALRWRRRGADQGDLLRDAQTPRRWRALAIKIGVVSLVYAVVYIAFGYVVAWRTPEIRAYYGGGESAELRPFVDHMLNLIRHHPSLLLLQVGRGVLWSLMALAIARTMRRGALETGIAVGLVFGILMNAQLLLPNDAMPSDVRIIHLLETAPSNFLIGLLAGALFATKQTRPTQETP